VLDRFLTGVRNQGPGAIPALILSLLALGAVAYWLLSRDDDRPTQAAEVVSAPATLTPTTTPDATTPAAPTGSDSGSGADGQGGGEGQDGGSASVPAIPDPSDSGASTDDEPAGQGAAAQGHGQRSREDEPPSLEDVQQILQGNDSKPDRHQGASSLPGLENLLGDGAGPGGQAPSGQSIEDLLDEIRSQIQN
jgi:hypothetical protein